MLRGVYGAFLDDTLIYIGSSGKTISELRENHFRWKEKWGSAGRTKFREALIQLPQENVTFKWLIEPDTRELKEVETLEGSLIRAFSPPLNIDKDPVKSSQKYGRYK